MKTTLQQKIAIAIVLWLTILCEANGQINKGTFALGPSFSFSSAKEEFDDSNIELKTSSFELQLSGDYFVIDNLGIGLAFGALSISSDVNGDDNRISGFSIGPQITYYISLSDNFYLFVGGGIGYSQAKEDDDFSDELSQSGIGYGLGFGMQYLVNNKLGAFLSIGPSLGKYVEKETRNEVEWNKFSSRVGVNFFF